MLVDCNLFVGIEDIERNGSTCQSTLWFPSVGESCLYIAKWDFEYPDTHIRILKRERGSVTWQLVTEVPLDLLYHYLDVDEIEDPVDPEIQHLNIHECGNNLWAHSTATGLPCSMTLRNSSGFPTTLLMWNVKRVGNSICCLSNPSPMGFHVDLETSWCRCCKISQLPSTFSLQFAQSTLGFSHPAVSNEKSTDKKWACLLIEFTHAHFKRERNVAIREAWLIPPPPIDDNEARSYNNHRCIYVKNGKSQPHLNVIKTLFPIQDSSYETEPASSIAVSQIIMMHQVTSLLMSERVDIYSISEPPFDDPPEPLENDEGLVECLTWLPSPFQLLLHPLIWFLYLEALSWETGGRIQSHELSW